MRAIGDVFYIFWALQKHRMEEDGLLYAPVDLRTRLERDTLDFDVEDLLDNHFDRDGTFCGLIVQGIFI